MSTERRDRTDIEIIICGFLVSLTIYASLNTAYGYSVPQATEWHDLLRIVVTAPSLQLLIFMFTLIRFVYGAIRIHEIFPDATANMRPWRVAWNVMGMLMLFIFFYIAGLSVQHAKSFYSSVIGVHLWDLVWFGVLVAGAGDLRKDLKGVMSTFLIVDAATVILLLVAIWLDHFLSIIGASVMVAVGTADLLWNRRFFFHPNSWTSSRS